MILDPVLIELTPQGALADSQERGRFGLVVLLPLITPLHGRGTVACACEAARRRSCAVRRGGSIGRCQTIPAHLYRGVSALVARDYAVAASRFAVVPTSTRMGADARGLEIYALAKNSRCDEARSRIREYFLDANFEPVVRGVEPIVRELCAE